MARSTASSLPIPSSNHTGIVQIFLVRPPVRCRPNWWSKVYLLSWMRSTPPARPSLPLSSRCGSTTGETGRWRQPITTACVNRVVRRKDTLRQAEQEAQARAAELEAVIEAMTDGVIVCDAREVIRYTNAAYRSLLE